MTDLPPEPAFLTRERLLDGDLPRLLAELLPDLHLLSDAERAESLAAMLAAGPDRGDGVWLFAYGSLIWNPTIHFDRQVRARVHGWHRAFCLSTPAGRGTPDNPGLLLGLDAGGTCDGAALHIPAALADAELEIIWRREMVAASYVPRWLAIEDADGAPIGQAIGFTMNPQAANYAGGLTEAETVRRLATAAGVMGSSADYLLRTRDGLRALGIADPEVERLADAVIAWAPRGPDPSGDLAGRDQP